VNSTFEARRVIENLKELKDLTGNSAGAQRLAWSQAWDQARKWLAEKLAGLPVIVEIDQAGNTWATLVGKSSRKLILGSHIDSVVNGGWLDGSLGVVAGLEVLRSLAGRGQPPVTICLVSWADEEGTLFGGSLFGSSLVTGTFDPDQLMTLTNREGRSIAEILREYNVDLATAREARMRLKDAAACLELHIEQGPVLESLNLPLAAVTGALGVERHAVRFTGQTAHAGSTPMHMRRDALAAAAKLELEVREIAKRHGGVCTMGSIVTRPGFVTAIVGQADCLLDQRHLDKAELSAMLQEAKDASLRFASEEKVDVEWQLVYRIDPTLFNPRLVELCAQAVEETSGGTYRMPSGPLHDAVEIARAGIPTAMMFVQSLRGLSHTVEEDTREDHLLLAVQSFNNLTEKTIQWIQDQA
jgi:hydantoinase/carbamoylase family amidase